MNISVQYVVVNAQTQALEFTKNKPDLSATSSMLALRRFSKTRINNQKVTEEIRKAALLIYDNFDLKCSAETRKHNFVKRMIIFIKKTCLKLILRDFISIASDNALEFNERVPLLARPNAD